MKFATNLILLPSLLFCGCDQQIRTKQDPSSVSYPAEILTIAKQIGFTPQAVAEARALTAEQLQALVEQCVREQGQSPAYWSLMLARDLAAPFLIEIVQRPGAFQKPKEGPLPESPAQRALAFLKWGNHRELLSILQPLIPANDLTTLRAIAAHFMASKEYRDVKPR